MKTHVRFVCSLLLPAWAPLAQAQTANPASPDATPVQMSPFQVEGSQDVGYLPGNSVSATRINTAISDLPFAIQAFTPEFMSDIQSTDLFDVVRYGAGITNASNAYNRGTDEFSIRGFQQPPQHDGIYESSNGNMFVDMADVDRVEVVEGPASLLYGAIAPGGTVNYITKRAESTPFANVTLSAGSYSYGRVDADINQPVIGDTLLFRLNTAFENGFEYVEASNSRKTVVDPTVTWNITPKVSLRLNYQWFQRNETPPAMYVPWTEVSTPASMVSAFSAASGYPSPAAALTGKTGPDAAAGFGSDASDPGFDPRLPIISPRFNTAANSDWRTTDIETINAELDFKVSDHWNGRFCYDYNASRCDFQLTGIGTAVYVAPTNSLVYSGGAWSVSPSWNAMSSAQQLAAEQAFAQEVLQNPSVALQPQNGTPPPVLDERSPRMQDIWGLDRTIEAEVAGNYNFSWGAFKPLVGIYADNSYLTNRIMENTGTAVSPNFQTWDLDPQSPTYYINQDTNFNQTQLTTRNTDLLSFEGDEAAYAIVNGSFFDNKIYVVAGARYNQSEDQSLNYNAAAGTNPYSEGLMTHATTPQVGIGYKITPELMWYASYSQSYTLPTTAYLATAQLVNGVPEAVPTGTAAPVIGTGYETGFKTDLMQGKISSTFSVYQITETNVEEQVTEILDGTNVTEYFQGTAIRGRGIEYSITWSPWKNWQVLANVSEEDITNTQEPAGYTYYLGEQAQWAAKTLGNLWTRYTFTDGPMKGFWVGGGFNYNGPENPNPSNADLFMPAYTLVNSALGYDWNWGKTRMSAQVNWDNMTNAFYTETSYAPGLPARVVTSLTTRF